MTWDLSCPDWEERLKSGRSLVPNLPLYGGQGERAVAVFNKLRLADVPGTPSLEQAGGDWFRDIVRALFGSLDPVTRARMIREIFLLVPKKNSKTTNGAGLMVTALLLNERPRAQFLLIGPTQSIADIAFDQAVGMVEADEDLKKRVHIQDMLIRNFHHEIGRRAILVRLHQRFDRREIVQRIAAGCAAIGWRWAPIGGGCQVLFIQA